MNLFDDDVDFKVEQMAEDMRELREAQAELEAEKAAQLALNEKLSAAAAESIDEPDELDLIAEKRLAERNAARGFNKDEAAIIGHKWTNIGIDSITFMTDYDRVEKFIQQICARNKLTYKAEAFASDQLNNRGAGYKFAIYKNKYPKRNGEHRFVRVFPAIFVYVENPLVDELLKKKKKGYGEITEVQIHGLCQPHKLHICQRLTPKILDGFMRRFKTRNVDICCDFQSTARLTKRKFGAAIEDANLLQIFSPKLIFKVKGSSTIYYNNQTLYDGELERVCYYDKYTKAQTKNRVKLSGGEYWWRRLELRLRVNASYKTANEMIKGWVEKLKAVVKKVNPNIDFDEPQVAEADIFKFQTFQKDRRKIFEPMCILLPTGSPSLFDAA